MYWQPRSAYLFRFVTISFALWRPDRNTVIAGPITLMGPGGCMNTHNRDPQVSLQKLKEINARLARHEKTSEMILIMVTVLGTVALIILGLLIARV